MAVILSAVMLEIYHQTPEMSSAHFSKVIYLVDCLIFRYFSDRVFLFGFFPSGNLEIRLLGCEDLLKPLTKLEEQNLTENSRFFTAHKAEEPPGKRRSGQRGPNFGDSFQRYMLSRCL